MSSFRSRPRLRLGPVDGHDEDFDPLLGRTAPDSAASLPSLSSAPARAAAQDGPTASVFDEPDQAGPDGELPPKPESALPPPPQTYSWQPISAEIPVRRLPSQPPGKGLFVFRNPWRGAPGSGPDSQLAPGPAAAPRPAAAAVPASQAPAAPAAPAAALSAPPAAHPEPQTAPPVTPLEAAPVQPVEITGMPVADKTVAAPPPEPVQPTASRPALADETGPEPAAPLEPVTPARWPFGIGAPDGAAAPAPAPPADPAISPAITQAVAESAPAPLEEADQPQPTQGPVTAGPADQPGAGTDEGADRPAAPARPARPARPRPPARATSGQRGTGRKPGRQRASRAPAADSRRAAGLPPLWALFVASFLTGSAALMTGAALAAPLGGTFQLFSDHLLYLMVLPLAALGLWIMSRQVVLALLAALVLLVQGVIVVPSLGRGPVGGDTRTIVGWASLAGSQAALEGALREADRQEARLLLLGNAPDSVLSAPPSGWIVAARPTPGDGAAITILSRGGWRAANVAGEPAMARTEDGSVTVIGVNPPDAGGDARARDAEINRSAARAGVQTSPTLAIGSFGVVPWNGAIGQFTSYGNVTRVRCGGLFGATQGLLAVDHAFVRGITVAGCRTTGALSGSGHRPIWIRLGAPEPVAAEGAGS